MRIITYILFLLFSLSMVGKTNLIYFIKKIKSPIELSSNELEDESRTLEDDENKERTEKEELKEKDSYYISSHFYQTLHAPYECNKHNLNFFKITFKSHFKEVATPPPELV